MNRDFMSLFIRDPSSRRYPPLTRTEVRSLVWHRRRRYVERRRKALMLLSLLAYQN